MPRSMKVGKLQIKLYAPHSTTCALNSTGHRRPCSCGRLDQKAAEIIARFKEGEGWVSYDD